MNILLTELSRSEWENLDLGHVYRPPVQLIRANYYTSWTWNYRKQIQLIDTKETWSSDLLISNLVP